MRKIGGVNMNTITHLTGKSTKDKKDERYCSVYESLKESLEEVKLYHEGKIQLDTWDEFVKKIENEK